MRLRRHREVPARLSRLEQRFAQWRSGRAQGARIPESLWRLAVASAREVGVSQTATVLKLDYYGLKRRMEPHRSTTRKTPPTAFVEIPSPVVGQARECVIEFDDGRGASMRVHLKGMEVPDLLALGRSFWRGE